MNKLTILFFCMSAFLFLGCGDFERENPDDPNGIRYESIERQYSSSGDDGVSSSNEVTGSSSSNLSSSSIAVVIVTCANHNPLTHFCDERDNRAYRYAKINAQTWMGENLSFNASGSVCYNNQSSNCNIYGRLYNWATAKDVCPTGWHLPTNEEWDALFHYADGTNGTESPYNSPVAGKYLKATYGWSNNGNGEDTHKFAALPGGYGYQPDPDYDFHNIGEDGYWWSASDLNTIVAYGRTMVYLNEASWFILSKSNLFSVRCLKN